MESKLKTNTAKNSYIKNKLKNFPAKPKFRTFVGEKYKYFLFNKKISIVHGIIHLKFTSNNTIATLTDLEGNIKACYSAGLLGFKGSKKSTKYAKDYIIEQLARQAVALGYLRVNLHFNGKRVSKRKFTKMLHKFKIKIVTITDLTGIPHNGCRPSKIRRI